jgi:hypothetical protein
MTLWGRREQCDVLDGLFADVRARAAGCWWFAASPASARPRPVHRAAGWASGRACSASARTTGSAPRRAAPSPTRHPRHVRPGSPMPYQPRTSADAFADGVGSPMSCGTATIAHFFRSRRTSLPVTWPERRRNDEEPSGPGGRGSRQCREAACEEAQTVAAHARCDRGCGVPRLPMPPVRRDPDTGHPAKRRLPIRGRRWYCNRGRLHGVSRLQQRVPAIN